MSSTLRALVINWFPGLPNDALVRMATHPDGEPMDALIIVTTAGGSIASACAPAIQRVTKTGTPVFLVPDKADGHGILRMTDQPLVDVVNAGATTLERVSIENVGELTMYLTNAVAAGLRGHALARSAQQEFSFTLENRPVSQIGMPDAVEHLKDAADREIMRGLEI